MKETIGHGAAVQVGLRQAGQSVIEAAEAAGSRALRRPRMRSRGFLFALAGLVVSRPAPNVERQGTCSTCRDAVLLVFLGMVPLLERLVINAYDFSSSSD